MRPRAGLPTKHATIRKDMYSCIDCVDYGALVATQPCLGGILTG